MLCGATSSLLAKQSKDIILGADDEQRIESNLGDRMMSGILPDKNHPIFSGGAPYQILNEETEDREKRARDKERCDKLFAEFGELRGRIIAGTITMEAVLDKVLTSYYSPNIFADPVAGRADIDLTGPRVYRSTEFYDLILGEIGFNGKIKILFKTLSTAGIAPPTDLRKAFKDVNETRNSFAHSLVGIDAQTDGCCLWESSKRTWEPVAAEVERDHRARCDKAMSLLSDVSDEIEKLHSSGKQYPALAS